MNRPLKLLFVRSLQRDSVRTRIVESSRNIVPEVEEAIELSWRETLARPGVNLFDGPVCRFEALHDDGDAVVIDLSRTSYRVLVGTHFCHPDFDETYGRNVMANAIGVSTGLLTADGFWVMGRRNRSVAYYPGRVHPFAGSIEWAGSIDLFDNALRELHEELALPTGDVTDIRLVGLVEDTLLRHPESIFSARTRRPLGDVTAGLDAAEHDGVWSVRDEPDAVATALSNDALTPVAKAVLLLGGRERFGPAWFETNRDRCAATKRP